MSARVEVYRENERGPQLPYNDSSAGRSQARGANARSVPGKWRWRLVASNGRILADSGQGYRRRIDCLNGCSTALGARFDGDEMTRWPAGEPIQRIPVVDLTRTPQDAS